MEEFDVHGLRYRIEQAVVGDVQVIAELLVDVVLGAARESGHSAG